MRFEEDYIAYPLDGSPISSAEDIPFARFVVHIWRNGQRDNVDFGGGNIADSMQWLRGCMSACSMGEQFSAEIWDCLTYSLVYATDEGSLHTLAWDRTK
jgi:hypothetical protein